MNSGDNREIIIPARHIISRYISDRSNQSLQYHIYCINNFFSIQSTKIPRKSRDLPTLFWNFIKLLTFIFCLSKKNYEVKRGHTGSNFELPWKFFLTVFLFTRICSIHSSSWYGRRLILIFQYAKNSNFCWEQVHFFVFYIPKKTYFFKSFLFSEFTRNLYRTIKWQIFYFQMQILSRKFLNFWPWKWKSQKFAWGNNIF